MNMNQLLDQLYESDADDVGIEKTAEQAFMGAIDTGHAPNPYEDMSLEELMKLAGDLQSGPEDTVSEGEMHKTAAAMFGGQLMAHAVVHELGLIKEAVANGICRVCKENHMDIESSSVCSACLHEEA